MPIERQAVALRRVSGGSGVATPELFFNFEIGWAAGSTIASLPTSAMQKPLANGVAQHRGRASRPRSQLRTARPRL